MNVTPRLFGILITFCFAGCGLFGSGSQEVEESHAGRTTYRAVGEPSADNNGETRPPKEKVPGETRSL